VISKGRGKDERSVNKARRRYMKITKMNKQRTNSQSTGFERHCWDFSNTEANKKSKLEYVEQIRL